jgi:hypothetical protein
MVKFTRSMMLATQFMLRVVAGKVEGVPRPAWSNFTFFYAIRPGRIRKLYRIEPTMEVPYGCWIVERDITFYLLDTPVAIVTMQGMRADGGGKGDDNTSWTQSRISYAQTFTIWDAQAVVGQWRDVEIPVISYCSFQMPSQADLH